MELDQEDEDPNPYVVGLEVGDEVYAFEEYVPATGEAIGPWYRGCVDLSLLCFSAVQPLLLLLSNERVSYALLCSPVSFDRLFQPFGAMPLAPSNLTN